ncbi:MAG: hypothetical protein ACOCTK_02065 [Candidatus Saliniplasma sp.]
MVKTIRVEVEESVWRKVKAKAALQGKNVKDFTAEIFRKEIEDFEM